MGATFFCSRRIDECAKVDYIFPTLAHALACSRPSIALGLLNVLKKDADAGHHSINQQFIDLLVSPIKAASAELSQTSTVFVIDALDECSDQAAVQSMLSIISYWSSRLPVKFFVTSRPEQALRRGFKLQGPDTYSKFVLHNVEKDIVSADIRLYLVDSLLSTVEGRSDFDASTEWPPKRQLETLVRRADKLFIYAATACQYIEGGGDVRERLMDVTSFRVQHSSLDTEPLDALYSGILERAYTKASPKERARMERVLSAVISVYDPLTIDGLAGLLEVNNLKSILAPLHSVISVPSVAGGRVSTFHASFPDFMTDRERSGGYFQDSSSCHRVLADNCLCLMNRSLQYNICGVSGRPPNLGITPGMIGDCISEALRYACIYWASHLAETSFNDSSDMSELLHTFLNQHLLHWFECLSLLGRLDAAMDSFRKLESWTLVRGSVLSMQRCRLRRPGS